MNLTAVIKLRYSFDYKKVPGQKASLSSPGTNNFNLVFSFMLR